MKLSFQSVRSMPQRNAVMRLYRGALAYFRENGEPMPTHATVETDLHRVPEGCQPDALHYALINDDGKPVAAMALVVGYPNANTLYLRRLIIPTVLRDRGYEQAILNAIVEKYRGTMTQLQMMMVKETPDRLAFGQQLGFQVVKDQKVALASGDYQQQTTLQLALPQNLPHAPKRQPVMA